MTAADLNGASVVNGEDVILITNRRRSFAFRLLGVLFVVAPEFELTVTCTDAAGNSSVATASPD